MKWNLLLIYILSIFYSCSSDDIEEITPEKEDIVITVNAMYLTTENPVHEMPDIKSIVYVYYDIDPFDLISSNYHYEGKGRFVSKENIIAPLQVDTIDSQGNLIIKPKYLKKALTLCLESAYYKGRFSVLNSYLGLEKSALIKLTNNP